MALFDRNDRSYGYRGGEMNRGRGFVDRAGESVRRGWDRVENAFEGRGDYGRDFQGRGGMDAGSDSRGMNRGMGNPGREREGLWANSWSDGAWTADAADRTDRDWQLGRGGGVYDRDIRPAEAGWRAGGMHGQGGMTSRDMMDRDRGMMDRDRGWNLGGGDRDWGHNWGSGNLGGGYSGMDRDHDRGMNRGGFMDRAQNAVRRGWDRVEETFDRDDDRHLGRGAMRGGTSWAGNYDRDFGNRGDSGVRGYRDDEGHYGVMPAHNDDELARPNGGYGMHGGGMNRYGGDYRGSGLNRGGMGRYDNGYRGGRNWF
jgi:hypothetical protein